MTKEERLLRQEQRERAKAIEAAAREAGRGPLDLPYLLLVLTLVGVFPSGQWGQTVNLLLFSFGGSNPPAPTKQEKSEPVSDWRRVRIFRFLRV